MKVEKKTAKERISEVLSVVFEQQQVNLWNIAMEPINPTGDPEQDRVLLEKVESLIESLDKSPEKKFIEAIVEAEQLGVKFSFSPAGYLETRICCGEKGVTVVGPNSHKCTYFDSVASLKNFLTREAQKLENARRNLVERLASIEKRLDLFKQGN